MSPGISEENKRRLGRINRNFFLHIHASKVHPHSLKTGYTFGLGIILGFLFVVLILTGVILMMNYSPTVERAYDSVKDIVFVVPGGRYIRNIHRWAAHGMVLVSFLHMLRVFYTGGYLAGRRLNWIIGVSVLVVVLFMNFSGYLLPWDQLAFWAVTIGSNIAASFRELTDILGISHVVDPGGFIKKLLIGDEEVGQAALSRFFMLHVIFLPVTLMVLTAIHIWRIRKDGGISRPLELSGEKGFAWPVVMWAELAILLMTVAVLLIMAFLFDAPLRERANPDFAENPAKSPWYFLGIQELVSYSAFAGGVIIPVLFLVFLLSIPYIDRDESNVGIWFSGSSGRRLTGQSSGFSLIITVWFIFLQIRYGWFRDWFPDIPQVVVMLVNPATLSAVFYVLWSVWIRRRTGSSRMSAIALFTCVMTGFVIYTATGIWFRGPNWEFFWSPSLWPVN